MGLATTIVINNNNAVTGTHAGVIVGSGRDAVLYDPGGSYKQKSKGSGDTLYGRDANLADYIKFQKKDGPNVDIYRIPTTPEQEAQIKERIENRGGGMPGMCAVDVSNTIRGIGPFESIGTSWTPSGLGRDMQKILKGR